MSALPPTDPAGSIDVFALLSPGGRELALSVAPGRILRDVLRTAAAKFHLLDASGGLGALQMRRQDDLLPLDLGRLAKETLHSGDRLLVGPEPPLIQVEAYVLPSGAGELHMHSGWEPKIIVDLPARFMKIILRLQKALELDESEDVPSSLRGFRRAASLALVYDSCPEVAPEQATITRYLSDLCAKLEAAAPKAPPLIDRVPRRGARLLFPVKIQYRP